MNDILKIDLELFEICQKIISENKKSEEWDIVTFKEFIDSLKGILDESVDISKACSVVHNTICTNDEYIKKINEKDASYLEGIWSELCGFPKDEERLKYSQEDLTELDEEEKKAIEWYKEDLKDICRKILSSEIPNMGPPEDPYAWPSDEQLRIWDNKTDQK